MSTFFKQPNSFRDTERFGENSIIIEENSMTELLEDYGKIWKFP